MQDGVGLFDPAFGRTRMGSVPGSPHYSPTGMIPHSAGLSDGLLQPYSTFHQRPSSPRDTLLGDLGREFQGQGARNAWNELVSPQDNYRLNLNFVFGFLRLPKEARERLFLMSEDPRLGLFLKEAVNCVQNLKLLRGAATPNNMGEPGVSSQMHSPSSPSLRTRGSWSTIASNDASETSRPGPGKSEHLQPRQQTGEERGGLKKRKRQPRSRKKWYCLSPDCKHYKQKAFTKKGYCVNHVQTKHPSFAVDPEWESKIRVEESQGDDVEVEGALTNNYSRHESSSPSNNHVQGQGFHSEGIWNLRPRSPTSYYREHGERSHMHGLDDEGHSPRSTGGHQPDFLAVPTGRRRSGGEGGHYSPKLGMTNQDPMDMTEADYSNITSPSLSPLSMPTQILPRFRLTHYGQDCFGNVFDAG